MQFSFRVTLQNEQTVDKQLKDIFTQRLKPRWKSQALITAKYDTLNKGQACTFFVVDTRLVFWCGCIALRGHRGDFGIWLNAQPWIWCRGSKSGTRLSASRVLWAGAVIRASAFAFLHHALLPSASVVRLSCCRCMKAALAFLKAMLHWLRAPKLVRLPCFGGTWTFCRLKEWMLLSGELVQRGIHPDFVFRANCDYFHRNVSVQHIQENALPSRTMQDQRQECLGLPRTAAWRRSPLSNLASLHVRNREKSENAVCL